MGWDSERLRKLPKVTKLGKAPEPQADPAPEAGLLMTVFDSPRLSQTRAPRQGSPATFWLRTLARSSRAERQGRHLHSRLDGGVNSFARVTVKVTS